MNLFFFLYQWVGTSEETIPQNNQFQLTSLLRKQENSVNLNETFVYDRVKNKEGITHLAFHTINSKTQHSC